MRFVRTSSSPALRRSDSPPHSSMPRLQVNPAAAISRWAPLASVGVATRTEQMACEPAARRGAARTVLHEPAMGGASPTLNVAAPAVENTDPARSPSPQQDDEHPPECDADGPSVSFSHSQPPVGHARSGRRASTERRASCRTVLKMRRAVLDAAEAPAASEASLASSPQRRRTINGVAPPVGIVTMMAAQNQLVADALRAVPQLARLTDLLRSLLASAGKRLTLTRYSTLYRENAEAHALYVLLSGTVTHMVDGEVIARGGGHGRPVAFGAEALLGARRQTSLVAVDECEIVCFPRTLLAPADGGGLAVCRELIDAFISAELHSLGIFKDADEGTVASLAGLFVLLEVRAAESIFEQGEAGDKFYILLHGQCKIVKSGKVVAYIDSKDADELSGRPFFGEMALLDSRPRMASVIATHACMLLVLPQRAFPRFLATVPDFRYRLRRLKELRRLQANLNMRSGSAMSYKIDHSGGGGGAGPPSAAVRSGGGEGGGDAAPADRGPGPRRARARSRAGTSSRLAQASDNQQ